MAVPAAVEGPEKEVLLDVHRRHQRRGAAANLVGSERRPRHIRPKRSSIDHRVAKRHLARQFPLVDDVLEEAQMLGEHPGPGQSQPGMAPKEIVAK